MSITFDEWFLTQLDGRDETEPTLKIAKMWSCSAFKAGAQPRQAEIDELNRKIAIYEKHINIIKFIHENQFDENSDTSWILGNLDGFFECLESDLKGK